MDSDPYGRAIRDFYLDQQTEPLIERCGDKTLEHPIGEYYFGEFEPTNDWHDAWLVGPLLDMGAGVGQQSLYFQEHFETVAIEISEHLVATLQDRGVNDARQADMFALRDTFGQNRFRSAFAHGTQVGAAGSRGGLQQFLGDLAYVTTHDATASIDGNDPDHEHAPKLFGYRADPAPGLGSRIYNFEYKGDVSEPLLLRLVSPSRLCDAVVGTGWDVTEIRRGENGCYYRAVLTKH